MPAMTAKDYFDLLCRTSRDGGFPSNSDFAGGCAYRGTDGRKCAVGLIIPNAAYNPLMEGRPADDVLAAYGNDIPIPDGVQKRELNHVQAAHDKIANEEKAWNHARFVSKLQAIPCFAGFADPTAPSPEPASAS